LYIIVEPQGEAQYIVFKYYVPKIVWHLFSVVLSSLEWFL